MSTVSKENFAKCLKQLRLQKNLSQAELGHLANVDRSYIGRIERLEVAPGINIMERLAGALGTTLSKMCTSDRLA